jgi:hypothetical protein
MKTIRRLSLITLGFLGVTSIVGGIPLMLDPTGHLMRMPLSLLEHSPFHSFLIPGALLFATNGVLSLLVFMATLRRTNGYENLVVFQGCVIAGWITVEVVLLQGVVWAHYVYWAVGLILFFCGLMLRRDRQAASMAAAATHVAAGTH